MSATCILDCLLIQYMYCLSEILKQKKPGPYYRSTIAEKWTVNPHHYNPLPHLAGMVGKGALPPPSPPPPLPVIKAVVWQDSCYRKHTPPPPLLAFSL